MKSLLSSPQNLAVISISRRAKASLWPPSLSPNPTHPTHHPTLAISSSPHLSPQPSALGPPRPPPRTPSRPAAHATASEPSHRGSLCPGRPSPERHQRRLPFLQCCDPTFSERRIQAILLEVAPFLRSGHLLFVLLIVPAIRYLRAGI